MEKTKKQNETLKPLKKVKEPRETQKDRPTDIVSKTDLAQFKLNKTPSPQDKNKKTDKKLKDSFPKNINEYRHIIDTFKVNDKELEWVLELRAHKSSNYIGEKNLTAHGPNFSSDIDYNYVKKNNWDSTYRGLSTDLEHLMRKRIGEQANKSQLDFEITLREHKDYQNTFKGPDWKVPKKLPKDHIESFLPPVTKLARKIFDKNQNVIPRPYNVEITKKDKSFLKNYELSKNATLASQWDHSDMEPYTWNYHNPNMCSFEHVLAQTANNSISKWTINLRDSYNSNNRMSMAEIKMKRSMLKDITNQKSKHI